jgi:predicted phage terminase large subunit-like protein
MGLLRQQVQADVFTPRMKAWTEREPGPVYWYGNSVERGVAQLIRQQIPSFRFELATADKYVRALPTAEDLWNPGRILLPEKDEDGWVAPLIDEISDFTGIEDAHDDQVDALAALGRMVLKRHRGATGAKGLNADIRAAWRAKGGLRLVAG